MPSIAKTKSGKTFRAPTDQARKLERRKEIKKNKRDRQQVRQTIAKCLNVDDSIRRMLSIERQMLGLDEKQFTYDVLKKKQNTLMASLERRKQVLKNTKDDEIEKINEKLQHYHQDIKELRHLADQERMARLCDIDTIPLPESEYNPVDRASQLMGPSASTSAATQVALQQAKKKVDVRLARARADRAKPPGPPCGMPPSLSDSEDEYGDNDDDDLAPVPIPDFDAPPSRPPMYQSYHSHGPLLRKPPGPPPLSMYGSNPMGIPVHTSSMPDPNAIISSAPVIRKETESKDRGPTVVSAAPQLRDLRKETVKLVPTQLKRPQNKPNVYRPVPPVLKPKPVKEQASKNTDDAYNDFMKELEGLI
ncbi:unnamed protein product [Auanema sp. JU1783]|nr:unnamed protein product [Auanema sp. JU1783]